MTNLYIVIWTDYKTWLEKKCEKFWNFIELYVKKFETYIRGIILQQQKKKILKEIYRNLKLHWKLQWIYIWDSFAQKKKDKFWRKYSSL